MTTQIPKKLEELLEEFRGLDPDMAADLLIEFADSFIEVPKEIAERPFSKDNLVPGCESEAYIWAIPKADATLRFYFAVENPQGISAKALAAIICETISGARIDEILSIDSDIVYTFFGKGLSMGKGQGLMGMLNMVKAFAKKYKG